MEKSQQPSLETSGTAITPDSTDCLEQPTDTSGLDAVQPSGPNAFEEDFLGAGLSTSGASAIASQDLAVILCDRIENLVRQSESHGLTIGEAQELIRDHKESSVSPRFSELEKKGRVLRVLIGFGRPSKRFPKGAPLYRTRRNEQTNREVAIYWVPQFVPRPDANRRPLARARADQSDAVPKKRGA